MRMACSDRAVALTAEQHQAFSLSRALDVSRSLRITKPLHFSKFFIGLHQNQKHKGFYKVGAQSVQETGENSVEEAEEFEICEPTVSEAMTADVISFTPELSIRDAVKTFLDKRISGAPVVDENGKLVGILSETDVMWKESAAPKSHYIVPPIYIGLVDTFFFLKDEAKYSEECSKVLARTVGDAMTKKVVTVTPDTTLEEAADVMLTKKVNRLPVCAEDGTLVGVLTRSDVLRGMVAHNCTLGW